MRRSWAAAITCFVVGGLLPASSPAGPRPGLTELLTSEEAVLAPLERLTERILLSEQEMEDAAREVAQIDHQIKEADRRLAALDGRSAERKELLRRRLRQMYKASRGGFVRLALNARDGEDLFAILSTSALVMRRDVKELQLYQREQAHHQSLRDGLRLKRRRKESARAELEKAREIHRQHRKELSQRLAAIHQNRRRQQNLERNLSSQQRALLRRVQALHRRQAGAGGFMTLKGRLPRPVRGPVIVRFGRQKDSASRVELRHQGLTFRPSQGAPVRAVARGTVAMAGPFSGYGRLVIVEHAGGFFSIYGFLGQVNVRQGDPVEAGRRVGSAGLDPVTGDRATYFELRHNRHALDPSEWLQ